MPRSRPTSSSLASSVTFRALVVLLVAVVGLQIAMGWRYQNQHEQNVAILGPRDARIAATTDSAHTAAAGKNNEPDKRRDSPLSSSLDVPSLLKQAGIPLTNSTLNRLPALSEIESMYGTKPVVLNLDNKACVRYRSSVPPQHRHIAPAGLFNAGTNMLATLLRRNCYIPERPGALEDRFKSGMIFQVPWGKHNPVSWRLHNIAEQGGKGIVQEDVLPVVVIRDPIAWMGSMCRHPYGVRLGMNCKGQDFARSDQPVTVPYKPRTNVSRYNSFVGLWRDWYTDWLIAAGEAASAPASADALPAAFVRFEDLLFRPDEVVQAVCDCCGGRRRGELYIKEDSAKGEIGPHKGGSGYLESIVKYGNASRRRSTLKREEDRAHVRSDEFVELLDTFHYSVADL